jgi:dihydrolipoamide dehydrogenase
LVTSPPKGRIPEELRVEKVLVCIGRHPATEGLGLETVGIATDRKGWVSVDPRMATSAPGIYAIGDLLGPEKIMLAHVASMEGLVAAENALGAT